MGEVVTPLDVRTGGRPGSAGWTVRHIPESADGKGLLDPPEARRGPRLLPGAGASAAPTGAPGWWPVPCGEDCYARGPISAWADCFRASQTASSAAGTGRWCR